MSRAPAHQFTKTSAVVASLLLVLGAVLPLAISAAPAAASDVPSAAGWCGANGASVQGWVGSSPNLPICGPGPAYGGYYGYVDIPGPFGASGTYYNATPGFQCVELAERYLSVVDGLAPVKANGAQVAENYHAAYPATTLVRDGSRAAIGHPPTAGGVISFSYSSSFSDDGHVAVVLSTRVNPHTGDGIVRIAQENVNPDAYLRTLDLVNWRLVDPTQGGGTEYNWPDAEWLAVPPPISPALRALMASRRGAGATTTATNRFIATRPSMLLVSYARRPVHHRPKR